MVWAMQVDGSFSATYDELERRMRALAEQDEGTYLPNCKPEEKVNHVLICMEPSLGRWARGDPQQRIKDGFRNFLPSDDVAILHFCVRRYLCRPGERYHITDVSKGAMRVKEAGHDRQRRYSQWFPLLQEEIDLVAIPNANIVAVGSEVAQFLGHKLPKFGSIIHYSPLAGRARRNGIKGHEAAFEAFKQSVSHEDLVAMAQEAMKSMQVRDSIQDETLSRLDKFELTDSRKQLMFNYKLAFDANEPARG
jgi:hypothetical protein